jgi:hypothetical protein
VHVYLLAFFKHTQEFAIVGHIFQERATSIFHNRAGLGAFAEGPFAESVETIQEDEVATGNHVAHQQPQEEQQEDGCRFFRVCPRQHLRVRVREFRLGSRGSRV